MAGKTSSRWQRVRVLLAAAAALVVPAIGADAALAGNASMRPSVQGFGQVTAPGYACSNFNQDDRVVVTSCGTTTATAPFFGSAVLSLTATPFANNGNQFSRWEGCAVPLGSMGTASAVGNVCTLTVSFFFADDLITPRAVFDDVAGPTISSVSPAYSTVTDRGVSFGVASNESSSATECSVDLGAFTPCSSVRQLPEGTHQVRARSFDLSGNLGNTTSNQSFQIVDTQLVSGPADFSNAKRPTFTYSSLEGVRFECSIDSVAIATDCGAKDPLNNRASFTPPADLPDGVHTFRVEAIDGPDFDRVPVVRTWTVDSTPPDTTVAAPDLPEGVLTTLVNASFSLSSSEPTGAAFECKLDGAAFSACTSPATFADLPFGGHVFQARAVDRAGNVDPSPATRNWEIAARDNDGDGFNQRSDCDDGDARVNPNATDAPDNGVDENCDGADSRSPAPAPAGGSSGGDPAGGPSAGSGASTAAVNPAALSARGSARGARILFTRLSATRVAAGSQITATCRAGRRGACPFRTKRTTARGATVNLLAALAPRRGGRPGKSLTFRAPATLTVTITSAGMAPKTLRYTMAKGKFPRVRAV
jgi:Putative metal-binding motif